MKKKYLLKSLFAVVMLVGVAWAYSQFLFQLVDSETDHSTVTGTYSLDGLVEYRAYIQHFTAGAQGKIEVFDQNDNSLVYYQTFTEEPQLGYFPVHLDAGDYLFLTSVGNQETGYRIAVSWQK